MLSQCYRCNNTLEVGLVSSLQLISARSSQLCGNQSRTHSKMEHEIASDTVDRTGDSWVVENEIVSDTVDRTNDSWVVDIPNTRSNMDNIPKKERKLRRKNTIYKIPTNIRENYEYDDYTPYKVSFGPNYHGQESYRSTENAKQRVFNDSLSRSKKTIDDYKNALTADQSNKTITDYMLDWIKVIVKRPDRKAESDGVDDLEEEAFLDMMIYDGCFLLEILQEAKKFDGSNDNPVWDIDGISRKELMEIYRHDVLLLENQIPLSVLEKLYVVQTNKTVWDAKEDLHGMVLSFFSPKNRRMLTSKKDTYLHILDLYRHSLSYRPVSTNLKFRILLLSLLTMQLLLFPLSSLVWLGHPIYILIKFILKSPLSSDFHLISFTSAIDLDKVGIGFVMSKTKALLDISVGSRNLHLPQIYIDGETEFRFKNIIAFEQVHEDANNIASSYVYLMSRLLQTEKDVHLLRSRFIIDSTLCNDDIVRLFNNLTLKHIVNDPDAFLSSQYKNVVESLTRIFYNMMTNPLQKDLWQNYLRSPLAIVSFFAAFLLFFLTTVQTVYTVLGYYNSK